MPPLTPSPLSTLKSRLKEAGNVLFMILLAVALFAALAYGVTQSTRSGGGDASKEQNIVTTSTILQTLANASFGLQRYLISNNFRIEEIDMFKSGDTLSGNTSSCTSDICNLHHPNGGNVNVPLLPNSAWIGSKPCCTAYVKDDGRLKPHYLITSVRGVGTDLPEIVAYYTLLKPEVCRLINIAEGLIGKDDIDNIVFTAGSEGSGFVNFDGANTSPIQVTTPNQVGGIDSRVLGKSTFGYSSGGNCTLIHVLIPR